MIRPDGRNLLFLAALLCGAVALGGCGLVWWGAAAGAGYFAYDSSVDEDDEEDIPSPVVSSVSQDQGEEIGGQAVTVNGKHFESGCRLFFGTAEAASVTLVNAFMLQAVTPAYDTGAAGQAVVDVRVQNPDGREGTLAGAYTYVDTLAPAAVSDLAVVPGNTGEIVVSFTAPGDNGPSGTAASYELRYYVNPIDSEAEWSAASGNTVAWPASPKAGGSAESETLSCAWQGTGNERFFALKTTDDAGNVSLLSNAAPFDPYPPDPVTDLEARPASGRKQVLLRFTATGDDGASGDATAYVYRYASTPILDEAGFDAARIAEPAVAGVPPQNPGATESRAVVLPVCNEGSKYYFAVKVEDEVGNRSTLSNGACETAHTLRLLIADGGPLPSSRRDAAVVYDPLHQRLVAYGGWDGSNFRNDIVTLNLKGNGMGVWQTLVPTVGTAADEPASGRYGASAVWDPLNHRMVIFGGTTSSGAANDTHYLDFSGGPQGTWHLVDATDAPSARRHAAAAYNPFRRRMIVAGGTDGTNVLDDVHELDLPAGATPSWITGAMTTTGSMTARWGAAPAFLPWQNRFLVFGGHHDATSSLRGIQTLNFNTSPPTWMNLTIPGTSPLPARRGQMAFGFDPCNRRLIVAGGREFTATTPTSHTDAWVFQFGAGGGWFELASGAYFSGPLWGASGGFDDINRRMVYAFGAKNGAGTSHNVHGVSLPMQTLEIERGWTLLDSGAAQTGLGRSRHAMAYDPGSNKIVMFGGEDSTGYLSDTWEFNLQTSTWNKRSISGPLPRRGHLMFKDPYNRRAFLIGGHEYDSTIPQYSYSNDIWEYDSSSGTPWTFLGFSGTSTKRENAAGCYDELNHRIIIYGGRNGNLSTDILANLEILDLKQNPISWSSPSPTGTTPPALSAACACFDPEGECMVLFGGEKDVGGLSNDTWLLHVSDPGNESWTKVTTNATAPPARKGAVCAFEPQKHRMVVFGGEGSGLPKPYFDDVWALYLNGHAQPGRATGAWVKLAPPGTGPAGRSFAALAKNPDSLALVSFGGETGGTPAYRADTHALVAPEAEAGAHALHPSLAGAPSPREGHSAVMDKVENQMIVFGGREDLSTYRQDLHVLRDAATPGNETWYTPKTTDPGKKLFGTPPSPRAGHGAFTLPFTPGTYSFVVGGADGASHYFKDVHLLLYDPGTGNWTWNPSFGYNVSGAPAEGRAWFGSGMDLPNMRLVMFGGETPSGVIDELWTLTIQIQAGPSVDIAWRKITPVSVDNPCARKNSSVVMIDESKFVLFGGQDDTGTALNDLWLLTVQNFAGQEQWSWSRLPDAGTRPPARWGAQAFAPPGMPGGFILGGYDGSLIRDFWTYRLQGTDEGAFTPVSLAGTFPAQGLAGASVVYDERNQRAILFGGRDGTGMTSDTYLVNLQRPARR